MEQDWNKKCTYSRKLTKAAAAEWCCKYGEGHTGFFLKKYVTGEK